MVNCVCFVGTPSNVTGCTSFVTLTTTVTSRETATVVSSASIKPATPVSETCPCTKGEFIPNYNGYKTFCTSELT